MVKKRKTSTKKKESIPKDGDVTYVKISGPNQLRKELLETAIGSAELLKQWESYHKLKEEKAVAFKNLNKVMKQIGKEVSLIKKYLPKKEDVSGLEKEKKEVEKTLKEKVEKIKKPEIKKEFGSHIDKEIDDIQNRLKNLNI